MRPHANHMPTPCAPGAPQGMPAAQVAAGKAAARAGRAGNETLLLSERGQTMSVKLFCDRCDAQVAKPEDVVTVIVNVRRGQSWDSREFMLCEDCSGKLDLDGFVNAVSMRARSAR